MLLRPPTTQEEAFLQAIMDDSQDPSVWLIFSDWLQEQGDPRGEITQLWAKQRFRPADFSANEATRLRTLLESGLRPYLPRYTNPIGMELAFVPRGTFWMSVDDENARNEVTLPHDFWMGVYPVTQGEYEVITGTNPSHFSRNGDGKDRVTEIPDSELSRFPVECVSWDDCQEFIGKLNEHFPISGWVYRLPTEAEWEYTCRGGAVFKEACSYHFYFSTPTNDLSSEQANIYDSAIGRPCQVGAYEPNALGIYDMHGNVWEWCDDQWPGGSNRVYRGGSWFSSAVDCRAGDRIRSVPTGLSLDLGLRLALVPVR